MSNYSLSHLSDHVLLHDLATLVAQDRTTTAALLAHLAEVDARKLYLPAAYPSMYAWCVGELRLSEDAAFRRIRAARTAREFPAIFPMLADGRLTLNAVLRLTPHLTPASLDDLLSVAAGKTDRELERLLAERFPKPDAPTLVEALGGDQLAAPPLQGDVMRLAPGPVGDLGAQLAAPPVQEDVNQHAPGHVQSASSYAKLAPLSAGRFALQVTIGQKTHDQLRYAQALLGHAVPSGDLAQVLDRALDTLVARLEQQRFAATSRSRPSRRRRADDSRHIPAAVRRAVWQRDGGRCTFVSDKGHRCEATSRLEFDHTEPFARGGQASPSGLRLRCRAHNQYAAERVYGSDFMRHKREQSQRQRDADRATKDAAATAERATRSESAAEEREAKSKAAAADRAAKEAAAAAERAARQAAAAERVAQEEAAAAERVAQEEAAAAERAAKQARANEITPWLRALGYRADEARRGAQSCDHMIGASLEDRLRVALRTLSRHCVRVSAA